MFSDAIARAIIMAAQQHNIEPSALLAIVEVETGGKTFELDGRTPALLYERHIAYREAGNLGKRILAAFVAAGLAITKWSKATQYKDQGSSSLRLALIAKARKIHVECANRSTSWGLGQTMGFNAESLGFASATAMVEYQSRGVPEQIDCIIRFLKRTGLITALNARDWKRVARSYNGVEYAQNRYDSRLADADRRWQNKLPALTKRIATGKVWPEQQLAPYEIAAVQDKLRSLGFFEVGATEATWGTRTVGAISAFQAHEGLPVSGHYDDTTRTHLEAAYVPREPAQERSLASVDDLRHAGSETVAQADKLNTLGQVKKWLGVGLVGGGGAEQLGLLGHAQDALDKADQAKTIWQRVHEWLAPVLGDPNVLVVGILLLVAGYIILRTAERIISNRLADHRSGAHAGVTD